MVRNSSERGFVQIGIVLLLAFAFLVYHRASLTPSIQKKRLQARLSEMSKLDMGNISAVAMVEDYIGRWYLAGDCQTPFHIKKSAPPAVKKIFRDNVFTVEFCDPKQISDARWNDIFGSNGRLPASCPTTTTPVKIVDSDCDAGWIEVSLETASSRKDHSEAKRLGARINCRPKDFEKGAPVPLKELWNWKNPGGFGQVMVTPMVAPLGTSKTPSVVFTAFYRTYYTTIGKLYAVDGKTGKTKWTASGYFHPMLTVAIGDVRGVGQNDVVAIGRTGTSHAYPGQSVLRLLDGNSGALIWEQVDVTYESHPALEDVDGDGQAEIILSGQIYNGKDGSLKSLTQPSRYADGIPVVADVHPHPGSEVIGSHGIFSPAGIRHCSFANPVNRSGVGLARPSDTYRTIVGGQSGLVHGYRSDTCNTIFTTKMPNSTATGPFNMADFDGDGELEYGSAGAHYYVVYETDGDIKWKARTKDYSSSATGSTAFDLNGDGRTEVLYNDEHYLRVYDGETGAVLFYAPNPSGTLTEYPVVADIDGDGMANVVIASNNYAFPGKEGVRAFDSPNRDWVGARKIWNQHAYYAFNVSDDGKIKATTLTEINRAHIKEPHLVGFRNNVPLAPMCFLD